VQVLRHKHFERDGVTSLVLACGAKKAKQLHPRQLGEFQVWLSVSSGCVVQGQWCISCSSVQGVVSKAVLYFAICCWEV